MGLYIDTPRRTDIDQQAVEEYISFYVYLSFGPSAYILCFISDVGPGAISAVRSIQHGKRGHMVYHYCEGCTIGIQCGVGQRVEEPDIIFRNVSVNRF